jgi:hypothetical protein
MDAARAYAGLLKKLKCKVGDIVRFQSWGTVGAQIREDRLGGAG